MYPQKKDFNNQYAQRSYDSGNKNYSSPNAEVKKSKSHAEFQLVSPGEGQKFEPFTKIFAWKTTKRFGFLSLEAYKNAEQKKLNGEPLEKGYEKWYVKLKTGTGLQTMSAIMNVKKKILFFDMGTTKVAVSPSKNYFSFLMPEAVKNAKMRR